MSAELAAPPYRAPLSLRASIVVQRALRWEFWPAWLFYIPVIAWILWLGLRCRRPTAFTAANPVMEAGGVVGESKAVPLALLQRNAPELVAEFVFLAHARPLRERVDEALRSVDRLGGHPIVLKPNIGQRGRGVAVVRDAQSLHRYLESASGDVLVQRYVGGEEFGVFAWRDPSCGRVQVYSITHKRFPEVRGDGSRTLAQLIADDARARLIAPLLWRRFSGRLHEIPQPGTRVPLVEIGAHCRGSLFVDATDLRTEALTQAIERLFDAVPGYHFGRIDLRCPSAEHLMRGESLQVLELNGVTAEAAHIYHPGTPLRIGYASMLHQWQVAFAIGEANARRGALVTGPLELLRRFREDLRRGEQWS